jgi:hypothetical protein
MVRKAVDDIETPTMKRKNGKTRSVGVYPFHCGCNSGQYVALPSPLLFTRIIPAIVTPRKKSSDCRRSADAKPLFAPLQPRGLYA